MEIILGRKEILQFLRLQDWVTVKKWKKLYGLPIRKMPNGRPAIITAEIMAWIVKYEHIPKKDLP